MHHLTIVSVLVLALLVSCSSRPSPIEDLPPVDGLTSDPGRLPKAPAEPPERVSVSHILCSYRGADKALRSLERTREEAKVRTEHILKLARAKDRNFTDLAKKHSDDSETSLGGGDLGVLGRGELHPNLEKAAFGLCVGQISDVMESPRGFHILHRHPPTQFQAAEIVVTYTEAKKSARYQLRVPRTRDEAIHLIEQIHERLLGGSKLSFEQEAIAHSDLYNHQKGGIYPIFKKGTHPPKLEEIVFGLQVGGLSGIIDTPTGFHLIKRLPVERIQIRQIVIHYRGPDEDEETLKRSRPEALQLAQKARSLALDPTSDFAELAAKFSDAPAKSRGGKNEPFGRGLRSYDFEKAAFSLEVGGTSEVVDTGVGFTIIKRIR